MYGSYSKLYASWCECYDPQNIETLVIEKYFSFEKKDVLDVGCGTGRFIVKILPKVKNVIGIDNDSDSIEVLKEIISERYNHFSDKVYLYHKGIEEFNLGENVIDLAVFTWSFYALDKEQILHSLSNIYSMLREDGLLIILQPVGGEFEEIMRIFFEEHADMDEYVSALKLINEVMSTLYVKIATDKIVSEFVISDLELLCEALKMFAITEGECNKEDLSKKITLEKVQRILKKYKKDINYHLSDEVDVFVYKKKG